MKRPPLLAHPLLLALLAASGASWAQTAAQVQPDTAVPSAGADYYSIQVASAAAPSALRGKLAALAGAPHARIDVRDGVYILRVGLWSKRSDAAQALPGLSARYPGAYVRTAAYKPEQMLTGAPPESIAGAGAAQSNVLVSRSGDQANVQPDAEIPGNAAPPDLHAGAQVQAAPAHAPHPAPDTAPLWALFKQQRYSELDAAIARMRRRNPGWAPPAKLLALRDEAQTQAAVKRALANHDNQTVIAEAARHPGQFDCSHVDQLWGLAEAQHALGRETDVYASYQRIMVECSNAGDRTATLYKARPNLNDDHYLALLKSAQAAAATAEERAAVEKIGYEFELQPFMQAASAGDRARALHLAADLAPAVKARRDAANATLIAWSLFNAGDITEAAGWFDTALAWEPGLVDARYGYALSQYRLQRLDQAELALKTAPTDEPRVRKLGADIEFARAQQAYKDGAYRESLAYAAQAESLGKSGRDLSMLRAWNAYRLGDDNRASADFIAAYRLQADAESAQGAVLSLARAGRWSEIDSLASSLGGAFAGERDRAMAQRYYDRKLFLAAHAADTASAGADRHFPQLDNLDTPTLASGAMLREKSGSEGTSKLRITKAPLAEGTMTPNGIDQFRLQLYRVDLDAGSLPAGAVVGSYPASGAYVAAPTTRLNGGFEPHLTWLHQAWLTPYAGIGLTPSGGAVSSALVGNLGVMHQSGTGNWRAELFSEPVRESVLSYTGTVDPYTGQSWGRVRRSGAMASGYAAINTNWGVSGQARLMDLEGRNVAGNQGEALSVGLTRNFALKDYEYFDVGPDISFEGYRRNLSQFTLGQGGYFSPSHLLSLGVSAHFLTAEARQSIVKGDASVGFYDKGESASPCFPLGGAAQPLAPACQKGYVAAQAHGFYYSAEFTAAHRLTDHLQAGAGALVRRNPQYQDKAGLLYLRYTFGARRSVMSADLPVEIFHSIY